MMPKGTETQKTRRQSTTESSPPAIRPMNDPPIGGDLVDAHGHTALVRREGVDEDGARVREEHRAPDALDETPQHEPQRAGAPVIGIEGEEHRRQGEDREAEVVDAHASHDVAETAEADHQHRGHEEVALQEPQQVAHVARPTRD